MQEECGTLALCDICCSCFLFPRCWGVGGGEQEEALFIAGLETDRRKERARKEGDGEVRVGSGLGLALAVGLVKADSRAQETWLPARAFWGHAGRLALTRREGEADGCGRARWLCASGARRGRALSPSAP